VNKHRIVQLGLFSGLLASLTGCRNVTVQQVREVFQSGKYLRTVSVNGFDIDFRYVPEVSQALSIGSIDGNRLFTKPLVDSMTDTGETRDGLLITMMISPKSSAPSPFDFSSDLINGAESGNGGSARSLEKYAFGLGEKIWLESEGRLYRLTNYQMINNWGLSKGRTFELMFRLPGGFRKSKAFSLVIEDLVPNQLRNSVQWKLPVSKYDFSN
jgi:hypothetical protein